MGRADYLDEGTWNARCSMCNAKRKASELVKNWMGQWRCPEHNEPRQPQDFVRGVPDIQAAPWVQQPGVLANSTAYLLIEASATSVDLSTLFTSTYTGVSGQVGTGGVTTVIVTIQAGNSSAQTVIHQLTTGTTWPASVTSLIINIMSGGFVQCFTDSGGPDVTFNVMGGYFTPDAAVVSVSPASVSLSAGDATTVTLSISPVQPCDDTLVTLVSSSPSVVSVPGSATVLAGAASATFQATAAGAGTARITGSVNDTSAISPVITVTAVVPYVAQTVGSNPDVEPFHSSTFASLAATLSGCLAVANSTYATSIAQYLGIGWTVTYTPGAVTQIGSTVQITATRVFVNPPGGTDHPVLAWIPA